MSTVVQHTQDHRGMTTSLCPRCGTQFVYWDDEDLDENGDLRCYCDGRDESGEPIKPIDIEHTQEVAFE